MTLEQVRDIVAQLSYRDWVFTVHERGEWLLQITFEDEGMTQVSRFWHLWPTMGESGVVKTAWAAVKLAEEHEAAERFRYLGAKPFNPHLAVSALVTTALRGVNIAHTDDPL
jgi:hypothetical protein